MDKFEYNDEEHNDDQGVDEYNEGDMQLPKDINRIKSNIVLLRNGAQNQSDNEKELKDKIWNSMNK